MFTTATEIFDFTTQSWSTGPNGFPAMANLQFVRAAALDGTRVLVVFGLDMSTGGGSGLTYIFDFATLQWTQKGTMNSPRWSTDFGLTFLPGIESNIFLICRVFFFD